MENTQKSIINRKFFLIAAFGHLLCWIGGDLLLFFQPNGFLDVQGLFDYEKTVLMLENANPLQFTISGIAGTVAMMLVFFGYYEIYKMLKPVSKKKCKYCVSWNFINLYSRSNNAFYLYFYVMVFCKTWRNTTCP